MNRRIHAALIAAGLSLAGAASADSLLRPVDNCATFLGSVSKELRFARALASGQRTSYRCPRDRESRAAIGAERERILRVLGTPDVDDATGDGGARWTYAFVSRFQDASVRGGGFPELTFEFDPDQHVRAVTCSLGQ